VSRLLVTVIFTAAAVVTAIVFAVRTALTLLGVNFEGFFLDGHWLMFAMGLLVYQRINYYHGRGKWSTWLLLGTGVIYGLAMRVLCAEYPQRHLGEYIAVAAAFALLLVYLKPWDMQIAKHWLVQPLNWCGKISYSIYLTHFPLVILVSSLLAAYGVTSDGWVMLLVLPLCVLLSLPLAWLFYMAVERHFINAPAAST
jgi:peptidoglycan/LPS O-acetylase OafA/YrhL